MRDVLIKKYKLCGTGWTKKTFDNYSQVFNLKQLQLTKPV